MTSLHHPWVVVPLLAAAVVLVYLGCAGLLLARGAFNKMHAIGPASMLGPLLVVTAVIIEQPQGAARLKALLILFFLLTTSPAMSHLVARAARLRREGHLLTQGNEK